MKKSFITSGQVLVFLWVLHCSSIQNIYVLFHAVMFFLPYNENVLPKAFVYYYLRLIIYQTL